MFANRLKQTMSFAKNILKFVKILSNKLLNKFKKLHTEMIILIVHILSTKLLFLIMLNYANITSD